MASTPGAARTISVTPSDRGLGVVRRTKREVNHRSRLLHHQAFRHIPGHPNHFKYPAAASQDARAIIEGPRQDLRGNHFIIADLETPAQRILALPELAYQFLAHDDRGSRVHLVFLPESASQQDRNTGRVEVVLPDRMADRMIRHARIPGAGRRKRHPAAGHRDRHSFRETGCGDRRKSLHAIQQSLKEGRGLNARVSIANRIDRDQIEVPGVEPCLYSHGRLYAEGQNSKNHQQRQRPGDLGHYQHVAQAQTTMLADPDGSSLLQRRCQIGSSGLQCGREAKGQPRQYGEGKRKQEDPPVRPEVVADWDGDRHPHLG